MVSKEVEQTDGEIGIREIILAIWNRKVFLVTISIVFAAIALGYARLTATYSNTISFNLPSDELVAQINTYNILDETRESLFSKFYEQINNKEIQLQVLKKSPLGEELISKIENLEETNLILREYVFEKLNDTSNYTISKNTLSMFNRNISLTLQGKHYFLQGDFLQKLFNQINEYEREQILSKYNQNLRKKIKEIETEIEYLVAQERNKRLSKIQRITVSDEEKILALELERQRLIDKAKSDRLARIDRLVEARETARDLGIIENNFKKINSSKDSTLTLSIGDNQKLPNWYLYGEKALSKEIELLQSRKSDESFIARINEIDYEIDKIKNNTELKFLKSREDDALYVDELFKLTAEKNKLLNQKYDLGDINFVTLTKSPLEKTSNSKTLLMVILGAIAGFIFGFFVISIQGALRLKQA